MRMRLYQVRLELGEVHIQCSIEPKRRSDGRDDLGDQSVEIRVRRPEIFFILKIAP